MARPLVVLLLGVALLVGSLVLGAIRIVRLTAGELELESPWQTLAARAKAPGGTAISARLVQADLEAGEQATFEVCAQGDLSEPGLDHALEFIVWREATQKLDLKVPLDAGHRALVRRTDDRSCLPLGGGRIEQQGTYTLTAVWPSGKLLPALMALPMRGRVLAKRPLEARDRLLLLGAALGAMLCVLSAFSARSAREARPKAVIGALWASAFGLAGAALFALIVRVPLPFALGGLTRGLGLSAVEVALALAGAQLVFRTARSGLALEAPARRTNLWLLVACAAALALNAVSRLSMDLVPSTGRAPIETYISWPSGALTFALLGMAVPLAEELFFRGFLYGALSGLGRTTAIAGTFALFALAHAQQAWGNWGALLSVALTGALLTLLRAFSGSTLVPAVTHILFNLSLWRASFSG